MSIQHYWIKWEIKHKECGTIGNIVHVFFAASGFVRFQLYCYACPTVFEHDTTFEEIAISCNDHDREKFGKQLIDDIQGNVFDLEHWDTEDEKEN